MNSQALSNKALNKMKKRLLKNLGFLQVHKLQVAPGSYTTLVSAHHRAVQELNNIELLSQSQESHQTAKMGSDKNTVVYDKHGAATVVTESSLNKHKEGWEAQFEVPLHNPPCYMPPPTNVYSIDKARSAKTIRMAHR